MTRSLIDLEGDFGSGLVTAGTGILLNNEIDGRPWIVTGGSGSSRIITTPSRPLSTPSISG